MEGVRTGSDGVCRHGALFTTLKLCERKSTTEIQPFNEAPLYEAFSSPLSFCHNKTFKSLCLQSLEPMKLFTAIKVFLVWQIPYFNHQQPKGMSFTSPRSKFFYPFIKKRNYHFYLILSLPRQKAGLDVLRIIGLSPELECNLLSIQHLRTFFSLLKHLVNFYKH